MKGEAKTKESSAIKERIEKELGKRVIESIEKQIQLEVKRVSAALSTQSAWIDHYLLIDFGFSGDYFYPNSVQFYGSTGFLCSKRVDNTSLVSLVPILDCEYVHVTWDTATKRAVHIYGYQSKS